MTERSSEAGRWHRTQAVDARRQQRTRVGRLQLAAAKALGGRMPEDGRRPREFEVIDVRRGQHVGISAADMGERQSGMILVYDDDRLLLEVLVAMLKREGHRVTATDLEQEAIDLARAQHFDLAVVDLGRQRSKGYDLVGVISATSPETSIVAMSAYPAQEVVRFAREYAQAFLEKPFSIAELVDAVSRVLAQAKPGREIVRQDSQAPSTIRVAAAP